MRLDGIKTEYFHKVITDLACEDGTEFLLTIPGVWECVSEFYNNDAIKHIEQLYYEYLETIDA